MKFIIAFFVALMAFLMLKAVRIGLKRLAKRYPDWNFRITLFSAIEFIIWLSYIFWALDYLFRGKFYYQYLVIALIFIVVGFFSWFLFRDIFAGVIFKVKHNLKSGTHIRFGGLSGNIKSQHLTYIRIRTDDGQLLRVPYSRLNHEVISEVTHTEALAAHTIHIQVNNEISKSVAESRIRDTILNTPWSNLKEEPTIKFLKESEIGNIFEIMLFSMSQKHMKFIEIALEKIPSLKVIS
ncbi:MAG: mechanosensitive ion channel [Bacteroidales bacterium]|nr:mechanosensitive ion channel [Bacteroidales bacterium]